MNSNVAMMTTYGKMSMSGKDLIMVNIIKASGLKAVFDPNKIRKSLNRVGVNKKIIEQIVEEVARYLKEDMTTHEIYRIVFRLLRQHSAEIAAKYHLKRAIMQLGISGYPFEKYMAELMRNQGYHASNNQTIKGYCVDHEVDVVAEKNHTIAFLECKYHSRQGIDCDVKISLYFKARFLDIEKNYSQTTSKTLEGWLVTNTRFTTDASKYGCCAGLKLLSWNFPEKGSLKELIEFSGLYPITCITSFTKAEIATLLANNIVLCKTVHENPSLLNSLNIPKTRLHRIIEQCRMLGINFSM